MKSRNLRLGSQLMNIVMFGFFLAVMITNVAQAAGPTSETTAVIKAAYQS